MKISKTLLSISAFMLISFILSNNARAEVTTQMTFNSVADRNAVISADGSKIAWLVDQDI
jgi:hypothetical protein